MKTILKKISTTLTLFMIVMSANAQKNYTLDAKTNFSVFGTSTLHDWEMKSASKTGTANLTVANSKLTAITSIDITLPVETIKSEKTKMDKIAYETLKSDKNKNIKYVLKSAEKVNETTWNLTGTYTIAGVSKEHKTQVKTSVTNGIVNLQGSNKITFKEFGMKSPTAMLGTIKTGEDLTIKFNINFK
ncbi:polyisoprenoid-binding protein YceI [Flavobacterium sp. 103]|uniref:YceI family protein n=1 Tax=unclassified Flavobacterium TaxID=196869 RepID=UPI000D5DF159|nr:MULTISPECIES: YceI family protein [unclassified Flavobacterium]PVX45249.1 polyisoprenoid-binding protein YceI [Flavobacterium sp. 103]QKJ62598.1 YceI family protein [Flavobacterium sp. M31R6]